MPEEKKLSPSVQQRKDRPKIEDLIPTHLPNDKINLVLDFVAWLRKNKMSPSHAGIFNAWTGFCNGKVIYRISLYAKGHEVLNKQYSYVISIYLHNISKYEREILNEGLQNLVWENIRGYCTTGCNSTKGAYRPCFPGRTLTLAGKEFKRVCCCDPFTWIFDPDEIALNGIKRLLELEQRAREEAKK